MVAICIIRMEFCADRCHEIVEIARKNDLLVVCDDVYHLLHLNGVVHPRLYSYDKW